VRPALTLVIGFAIYGIASVVVPEYRRFKKEADRYDEEINPTVGGI
jgi:hypothetical protein